MAKLAYMGGRDPKKPVKGTSSKYKGKTPKLKVKYKKKK